MMIAAVNIQKMKETIVVARIVIEHSIESIIGLGMKTACQMKSAPSVKQLNAQNVTHGVVLKIVKIPQKTK